MDRRGKLTIYSTERIIIYPIAALKAVSRGDNRDIIQKREGKERRKGEKPREMRGGSEFVIRDDGGS